MIICGKISLNDNVNVGIAHVKQVDTSGQLKATQHSENGHEQLIPSSANDKKKKKRKRKEVKDLRFLAEMDKTRSQLKKKERKKK